MNNSNYNITIGLEVHVHLKTDTKVFCRCPNEFGAEPNTNICPVCTGQPGSLPVLNKRAVEQAILAALALNFKINYKSIFARKQYFYPDLPKNYQISQYEIPLAENGFLKVEGRKVNITRAHLEEDAGKLIHGERGKSMVDYNRTGTPLLEIVTEPEIKSPKEAGKYLRTLKEILMYCGVSDCDMEKGSLRCDANLSLKEKGDKSGELGVKTEVKNMNSFKAVEKALSWEAGRQAKLLDRGQTVNQETRLWDEDKEMTLSMRSKEEAHDYRYFPDPDLPPLVIQKELVEKIKKNIPELPEAKRNRYVNEYGLSEYDSKVLTREKEMADFFESAAEKLKVKNENTLKKLTNWLTVELTGRLNSENISIGENPVSPGLLAELIDLINDGTISGKMAKKIFKIMWEKQKAPSEIVKDKGMQQINSEDKIENLCRETIDNNPEIVKKYINGKEGVIGPLVGNIMQKTKGQANPQKVNQKLREMLEKKKK
ncbi:MAG: Asp-tRNA(Asn)/Glu-tRNA(Gln) amidotransferase subunit GatB [Elusimicrobiota bacterium]